MVNKKASFDNFFQEISDIAKALSHPARLEILRILARRRECICGDIVDLIPLAQSTVSQHLKSLKQSGLIKGEIDGPKTCYCLDTEKILKFKKDLNMVIDSMFSEDINPCC